MDELLAKLEQGGVTLSGLRGMGGVGKTALALKLAEQLAPRYPDAQFFLDLRGTSRKPLTSTDAMAHVIRGYHPMAKLPESEAELRGLYCSVLSGQHALLLMDNAQDAAQVEPLLPPVSCLLLVTSRQHFHLSGLYAKNLDTLPSADAQTLLLTIAPRVDGQASEIAQLCGCLPLALTLAGKAVAERETLSVPDYVRRLQDARKRLEFVDASLGLSYDLLAPELQRRWCMLVVFPATFDRSGAAAVWELEPDAAQDVLDELARYSLVEWNGTTSRYGMHDLVRLFTDARLDEGERAAAAHRHAAHYQQVLWSANQLFLQGGDSITRGLALFDLEWPNIQGGQMWAKANTAKSDKNAEICSNFAWTGSILNLQLHPREYVGWLEAALVAARQTKNREAEDAHLGNLGSAYADLGDARRAIEFYEQQLVITREIGDRQGEGAALGNLGSAYADLGDARRAIEFYEQALVITREIGDRRGEGAALGNLGNAHSELGERNRVIEFHKQALAIAHEIGDRRGEGNHLWNMADEFDKLGDRAQAIAQAEAALEIFEQIESPYADRVRKRLAEWQNV